MQSLSATQVVCEYPLVMLCTYIHVQCRAYIQAWAYIDEAAYLISHTWGPPICSCMHLHTHIYIHRARSLISHKFVSQQHTHTHIHSSICHFSQIRILNTYIHTHTNTHTQLDLSFLTNSDLKHIYTYTHKHTHTQLDLSFLNHAEELKKSRDTNDVRSASSRREGSNSRQASNREMIKLPMDKVLSQHNGGNVDASKHASDSFSSPRKGQVCAYIHTYMHTLTYAYRAHVDAAQYARESVPSPKQVRPR